MRTGPYSTAIGRLNDCPGTNVFPARVFGGARGATLVEMLVVIAIILIIAGIGLGGRGAWKAKGVTNGGNEMFENLALAREMAISRNQPVEVWLLQKNGNLFVDALQIRLVSPNGDTVPVDKVQHLPTNVGIDTNQTLSPLITNNAKIWPQSSGLTQPPIPDYSNNYGCWYVRFMPDGSTTLSSNLEQYVTVHEMTMGNGLSQLPKDYALLSISPQTGKITLYRP